MLGKSGHSVVIGPKVSDIVSHVARARFYLLVVPENKSIGTNTQVLQAARRLLSTFPHPIKVHKINFRFFTSFPVS